MNWIDPQTGVAALVSILVMINVKQGVAFNTQLWTKSSAAPFPTPLNGLRCCKFQHRSTVLSEMDFLRLEICLMNLVDGQVPAL